MNKQLYNLAKQLGKIQREAVKQTLLICEPEVEHIIATKSRDFERIEHTLDALVEVAFDEKVLVLFKKLLRYYFEFNPSSVAFHIDLYR
ncbi:MAG: hypothetical protein KGV44_08520 [Flavobacteriaceae bacterium]|nr:hypothetical protein [Flavobacteriaceae bacterium]